jgi:hypothetical protein
MKLCFGVMGGENSGDDELAAKPDEPSGPTCEGWLKAR